MKIRGNALCAYSRNMEKYIAVVRTPDLGPGDIKEVEAHGHVVGVTNVGQTYYAFEASCPVDGTNLAREGLIKGEALVCPQDNTRFDIRTGASEAGAHLQRYAINVEENQVKIGPPIDE